MMTKRYISLSASFIASHAQEANSVKKLQFVTTAQEYQLYLQQ